MRVSSIAGGGHHSAVVEEGGQLWTCGKGSYGQLGHGDTGAVYALQMVEALRGNRIAKVGSRCEVSVDVVVGVQSVVVVAGVQFVVVVVCGKRIAKVRSRRESVYM